MLTEARTKVQALLDATDEMARIKGLCRALAIAIEHDDGEDRTAMAHLLWVIDDKVHLVDKILESGLGEK